MMHMMDDGRPDPEEMYYIAKQQISADRWDVDYYEALLYTPSRKERRVLKRQLAELPVYSDEEKEESGEAFEQSYRRFIIKLKLKRLNRKKRAKSIEALRYVQDVIEDYSQWL